MKLFDIPGY
jgi:hypothetical protein